MRMYDGRDFPGRSRCKKGGIGGEKGGRQGGNHTVTVYGSTP